MRRSFVIIVALVASFLSTVVQAGMVEKKQVRLTCSPLPYVFDCSIPLVANPEFASRCFYVDQEGSSLMRADHRMGFSNPIVNLQVKPGMAVTGVVTEKRSGHQSQCEEDNG